MIRQWFRWLTMQEAALVSWASAGGLTALYAYVHHLGALTDAKAAVILSALATIWTALSHDPPELALLTGALTTVTAAIGVSFHPSAHLVALIAAIGGVVVGFLHRHAFPPVRPQTHPRKSVPPPFQAG